MRMKSSLAPPLPAACPAPSPPASTIPHLIDVVDSRAHVSLFLKLVSGMPVAHRE